MAKTNSERETIVRRAADEQGWEVFTEDPRVIRKLTTLYGPGRQDYQSDGLVWELPKSGVSFRKPRELTAEQRELLSQRAKAMAAARKEARDG